MWLPKVNFMTGVESMMGLALFRFLLVGLIKVQGWRGSLLKYLITENQVVRLCRPLAQFQEALSSSGETGKMLDFLLQELNREANTTLSKSTDLTIKEAALSIKAEVEKLREQVQNVE